MSDETNTSPVPTRWPELSDPGKIDEVIAIIAEEGQVERDKIVPEATLESLGLESMDVVTILMGVEDKLDVYLPMDTELESARNLAEFVTAIFNAIDKSAAAEATKSE